MSHRRKISALAKVGAPGYTRSDTLGRGGAGRGGARERGAGPGRVGPGEGAASLACLGNLPGRGFSIPPPWGEERSLGEAGGLLSAGIWRAQQSVPYVCEERV